MFSCDIKCVDQLVVHKQKIFICDTLAHQVFFLDSKKPMRSISLPVGRNVKVKFIAPFAIPAIPGHNFLFFCGENIKTFSGVRNFTIC